MRPRIRNIKPEIFHDEELWALGEETHMPVLQGFQGLWCYADKEGRFEWRPRALKSLVLPYWSGDFERLLDALVGAGMVIKYTVSGRDYGWVRSLTKHQSANHREPGSVLPAPPEIVMHGRARAEPTTLRGDARAEEQTALGQSSAEETDVNGDARALHRGIGIGIGSGSGIGSGIGIDARAPEPDGDPPSEPESTSAHGVPRTFTMPSEAPPQVYLDQAVMGGVTLDQARSTWKHYFDAGLPLNGVERLHGWLVSRAIDRGNQLARVGPRHASADPDERLQRQADRVAMLRRQEAAEEAAQGAPQ